MPTLRDLSALNFDHCDKILYINVQHSKKSFEVMFQLYISTDDLINRAEFHLDRLGVTARQVSENRMFLQKSVVVLNTALSAAELATRVLGGRNWPKTV